MEIYKTTNNITGEFYIGMNSTCDPNYLGSGVELKKQITEYGKDNFTKQILCLITSNSTDKNALRSIESIYIRGNIDNPLCINKSKGYSKFIDKEDDNTPIYCSDLSLKDRALLFLFKEYYLSNFDCPYKALDSLAEDVQQDSDSKQKKSDFKAAFKRVQMPYIIDNSSEVESEKISLIRSSYEKAIGKMADEYTSQINQLNVEIAILQDDVMKLRRKPSRSLAELLKDPQDI